MVRVIRQMSRDTLSVCCNDRNLSERITSAILGSDKCVVYNVYYRVQPGWFLFKLGLCVVIFIDSRIKQSLNVLPLSIIDHVNPVQDLSVFVHVCKCVCRADFSSAFLILRPCS